MIRITSEITYGYHNGKTIEKKTKSSPPFKLDEQDEKKLVERGFAEYVASYDMPDGDITLDYLRSLKMVEIKKIGEEIGVNFKVGTKKEDYIQKVWAAYNPPMQIYEESYNPFGYPEEDHE